MCFFLGGGRGEEVEAEVDVTPLAVLPQPPPVPSATPVPHVQPLTQAVTPSLFQASTQPEVLLPKPVPVYSDSVRILHIEASWSLEIFCARALCALVSLDRRVRERGWSYSGSQPG